MGDVLSYNTNKHGINNATTVFSLFSLESEETEGFLYKCN